MKSAAEKKRSRRAAKRRRNKERHPVRPPISALIKAGVAELARGVGSVETSVQTWCPSADPNRPAELTIGLRVFGLDGVVRARIHALTEEKYPHEWDIATGAAHVVDFIRIHEETARSVTLNSALADLIESELNLENSVLANVYGLCKVPQELGVAVTPSFATLPDTEQNFWRSVSEDHLWYENFGEYIYDSLEFSTEGPLYKVIRELDQKTLDSLPGSFAARWQR